MLWGHCEHKIRFEVMELELDTCKLSLRYWKWVMTLLVCLPWFFFFLPPIYFHFDNVPLIQTGGIFQLFLSAGGIWNEPLTICGREDATLEANGVDARWVCQMSALWIAKISSADASFTSLRLTDSAIRLINSTVALTISAQSIAVHRQNWMGSIQNVAFLNAFIS